MTRVTLDTETLAKLHGGSTSLEVYDEAGRILGMFYPLPRTEDGKLDLKKMSPYTDEEIAELAKQKTGRPLKDIMKDLTGE